MGRHADANARIRWWLSLESSVLKTEVHLEAIPVYSELYADEEVGKISNKNSFSVASDQAKALTRLDKEMIAVGIRDRGILDRAGSFLIRGSPYNYAKERSPEAENDLKHAESNVLAAFSQSDDKSGR